MRDLFAGLYPRLPDVVQTYREWQLDLMSMWLEVIRSSEHTSPPRLSARPNRSLWRGTSVFRLSVIIFLKTGASIS